MKKRLSKPYNMFFGTLANQYRLDIINVINNNPKNVSQICKETNFNQSTVSHNLKRLEECGFIFVKPNGKERVYHINKQTLKPLLNLMNKYKNNYCSD